MKKANLTPPPQARQCWGCLTLQPARALNHRRVCQTCRDVVHYNPRAVAIREAIRRRREAQS